MGKKKESKGPMQFNLYTIKSLEGWRKHKSRVMRKRYVIKLLKAKAQYFNKAVVVEDLGGREFGLDNKDNLERLERFEHWCENTAKLIEMQVARDEKFAYLPKRKK